MANPAAVFVPWLHMHQPPIWSGEGEGARITGNLEKMLDGPPNSEEQWNAQWYAQAYKNPAAYTAKLCQEGYQPRIMVDYSGVLLEEMARLSRNGYFHRIRVAEDAIGDAIVFWRWVLEQYPEAIEFAGTAYSHCYFPTTPERDWEAQIREWQRVFAELFGKDALARVRGFWLPEMGTLGNSEAALRLLRLLKRCGYEWLVLPRSALYYSPEWSVPEVENRAHWLEVEAGGDREKMLCIVRDTDMGIRQQSGQNADGCINDIRYRAQIFVEKGICKPPLVVPTSDGENGNVMMFEYFSKTFAPLFRGAASYADIAFTTVSQYLDTYGPPETQIRLQDTGGSWIGGHQSWNEGDRRQKNMQAVEALSQDYARAVESGRLEGSAMREAKRALLLCETSCFVYWNSPFWFDQGDRFLAWARAKIDAG